jgi:hypothetical protein
MDSATATACADPPLCGVAVTVTCGEELPELLLLLPPHATIPRTSHRASPSTSSQRLRRPAKINPIPPNGRRVANSRPGFINSVMVTVVLVGTVTVTVAG